MKQCLALLILAATVGSIASAQQPSKWCRYRPIPPDSIIALHYDTAGAGHYNFSGDPFSSRTTVTFTGGSRTISQARRRFLQGYDHTMTRMRLDTLLVHEVEVQRARLPSLWLPIQESMFDAFRAEVLPGDTITVFLDWAGVDGVQSTPVTWVFLMREFSSRPTAARWAEELSTCRA